MLKRFLKNERGLTLIELLAVVVILGIIAAIAVPSIGGLIDNSKKDAHVANAQQMINSAKIAVTGDSNLLPKKPSTGTTASEDLSLKELIDGGYIEPIKDPDSGTYTDTTSEVVISTTDGKTFTYAVYLTNGTRSIGTASAPIDEEDLKRSEVK